MPLRFPAVLERVPCSESNFNVLSRRLDPNLLFESLAQFKAQLIPPGSGGLKRSSLQDDFLPRGKDKNKVKTQVEKNSVLLSENSAWLEYQKLANTLASR